MIYVAGDHYAVELVDQIADWLKANNREFENLGSESSEDKLSLQDMIPRVTIKVKEAEGNVGILVCGTGVGVEVGSNRFKGIRASLANTAQIAEWARNKDNANVLCLSSWAKPNVDEVLKAWFTTEYDGDQKRLEMLEEFDNWS